MSEENKKPLPSTINSGTSTSWTSVQAYVLASFCLVLGVALGYLFRGSASPLPQATAATQITGVRGENTQAQAALQQSVVPLLEAVNRNPDDYDALVKLGDLYYDGQQFPNAIQYYERAVAIHPENPDVRTDQFHIDILTAHFVRHPDWFDVVVGSNLFGDILSDLGPAVVGSIGIAPSANLNPEHEFPSMFEPVHGSAPDIAGKGIANPIGQIWSGAMMLRHLGVPEAADAVENAIVEALQKAEVRTPDIGGNSSTADLGAAIAKLVSQGPKSR